uniref:Uncharacterized protein n=2 Tax=Aegilops tauschii subsp. strangulata TaxID=200361 RepID=A0A453J6M6_AEGTS
MAASMRSQLKLLVSQGRRPWSYPILNSSLSSTRSDPPHKIHDPTGGHPADKAGDTPAVQQPPPAPAGMHSATIINSQHACITHIFLPPNLVIIICGVAVSDLDHLPSPKHIGHDGALVPDLAAKPKLGSSTSFPRRKIYDPVSNYSFHEES